jgi:hypothetical protein
MICIGDGFCGDRECAANGCKIERAWAAGDITPINDAARAAQAQRRAPAGKYELANDDDDILVGRSDESPADALTRLFSGRQR